MAARQPAEAGAILVPSTSGWARRTEVMADVAVEVVEAVEVVAEADAAAAAVADNKQTS